MVIGLRLFLYSCGIASCLWAYADPRFRDAEGLLTGRFCLPVTAGVALLVLGWAVYKRWGRAVHWFALALLGQGVALQMVEAGPLIRYQHYKSLTYLLSEKPPLLLMLLGLQTALVMAGLRCLWPSIRAWLGCTFKVWQLVGIGLACSFASAAVSPTLLRYVAELCFATFVQFVNLGNLVLIVWTLPEEALAVFRQRYMRWLGLFRQQSTEAPGRVDRLTILAAAWVTVLAAGLSFFIYERHPHIPDEVMYLYHARYVAAGALTTPAAPVPEAFSLYLIPYASERWYSPFPPGWPLALALGVLCGMPWLVNPVLAGLNVLAIAAFLREMYDHRTARLAVLLLCASPWYIFMGMNFMAHTLTLSCALAAALAVLWARKTGKAVWAGLGGGAVGLVSLIRPLDGLAMAGLLGLWVLGCGGRRLPLRTIATFVFGAVVVGSLILPYNKFLTGDPFVFPLTVYYDTYYGPKTNALGFGPERGLGWPIDPFPGHSPIDALINASLNTFSINIELFGWSIGSLIMIALLLCARPTHRSDRCMLAVIVTIVGVYSLYWFSGGPDFGARYWYLILVPCVALTARGIQFLEGTAIRGALSTPNPRVLVAVLALCVSTGVNYFPWRTIDKYYHYLRMRPDIRVLAGEYQFGKSLVLIRGNSHPDYASAWTYNPLDVRSDTTVYAWDRAPGVRARVLQAYPDRPVWIVEGPSVTQGAFKVIEGPVSASTLAAKTHDPQQ